MKVYWFYLVIINSFLNSLIKSFSVQLDIEGKNETAIEPAENLDKGSLFQFNSASDIFFGNSGQLKDLTKKSYSKSESFFYSNINGKVNKEIQGSEFEQINDKDNEKKYASIFHQKNDKPFYVKTKATSSNETEALILGPDAEEKNLTKEEETDFMKEKGIFINKPFENMFSNFNPFENAGGFGFNSMLFGGNSSAKETKRSADPFEEFFKRKSESFLRGKHK